MSPRLTPQQIAARARAYGLDPSAVGSVGRTEGYGGGVGDGGHAFGPFQLNDAGGVLTGKFPGWSQGRKQEWAWSPQGVDYALQGISRVARGKRGGDAVRAIVSQFERPADPQGEITKALGFMGGGAGAGSPPSPVPAAVAPPSGPAAQVQQQDPRQGLFQQLGKVNDGDYAGFYQQLGRQLKGGQQQQPMQPSPVAGQLGHDPQASTMPTRQPQAGNMVKVAKTADRQGVSIQPQTLQFVSQVASVFGKPLTVGTGTNHNEFVAGTHRQSAHWTGNAADIPARGDTLTRLGQSALIAAGADPKWARQQKGGLFNIGGKQVIFNSMEGGNHWDHLHVGLRR